MTTSIQELQTMTEAEKTYRMYERLEEFYCLQGDWKNALVCKWGMLRNQGGSL